MQEAKGKTFLKVTGILLIIFGALGLISSLVSMAGASVLSALAAEFGANLGGILMLSAIVSIVLGAVDLVAGILGVKNAQLPEKAQVCFIMGIIMVLLQVVSFIFALVVNSSMTPIYEAAGMPNPGIVTSVLGLIVGLVLPVLYLVGANKNKQSV